MAASKSNSAPDLAHVELRTIQCVALGVSSQVYTEVHLWSTPGQSEVYTGVMPIDGIKKGERNRVSLSSHLRDSAATGVCLSFQAAEFRNTHNGGTGRHDAFRGCKSSYGPLIARKVPEEFRVTSVDSGRATCRCMLLLMFRRHALFPLVLAVTLSPGAAIAQLGTQPVAKPPVGSRALQPTAPVPDPVQPAPQIVVTSPPPAPAPWSWHDKVLWGVEIVLVVLGYAGVLLALKTLKNIQRQTEFGVSAAQAALQCANAALESSQAIVDSGRPWIVITVEPFLSVDHGFKVMATNRGRTPARILAKADCVKIAKNETELPAPPDYDSGKSATPFEPIILLPGETAGIRPFRRSDVRSHCSSDEQFKRLERWEKSCSFTAG